MSAVGCMQNCKILRLNMQHSDIPWSRDHAGRISRIPSSIRKYSVLPIHKVLLCGASCAFSTQSTINLILDTSTPLALSTTTTLSQKCQQPPHQPKINLIAIQSVSALHSRVCSTKTLLQEIQVRNLADGMILRVPILFHSVFLSGSIGSGLTLMASAASCTTSPDSALSVPSEIWHGCPTYKRRGTGSQHRVRSTLSNV